ncbi:Polypyrimidine tract-binding protein 2 [Frankliniella fusca]|uniref:Polypyrimidine tract-binding protein 2 n=1 Tax=Frankliniella fusca TaxID=407009 RepID=A0AAE1GVK2_9NEOP|nr:Polypyrimidine tract-binding protein 2 [Frankliniella fusca]
MGRLAKQPDRKKWIEWICINLNIHESAIASHVALLCSDHFNSVNIMKRRLKLGSVPELFVEPNINIVRDCIGGLVIMYLFYICNCLNLKPSVSNVAKAEYRSVLDQPNGNAVVYKFFQDHIMRDVDISNKTVEIDESLFNKRKYNKRRRRRSKFGVRPIRLKI